MADIKILILLLTFYLTSYQVVYAIGTGGPISPAGEKKFVLSITPFYQSREMKDETTGTKTGKSYDRGIYVNGIYGFYKDFDISVKWGGVKNKFKSNDLPTTVEAKAYKFSYGGGVRGTFFTLPNEIHIGAYGQYFRHGRYDYGGTFIPEGSSLHGRIEEWDAGLYVYRSINGWTPYAGGRYSDKRMDFEPVGVVTFSDYMPRGRAGIFIGLERRFDERWGGTFEGRFIDETSGEISIFHRF